MSNPGAVTLVLLDPDNHPVAGALVGMHLGCHLNTAQRHWLSSHEQRDRGPARSDEQGRVVLSANDLFPAKNSELKAMAVYALHAYRRLAGLVSITRAHIGKEIKIKLKRAARIHGRFDSPELRDMGRAEFWWTNVCVDWSGHRPLSFATSSQAFEFLLPPGKYDLVAYGRDVQEIRQSLKVGADARDMEIDFSLPVTDLTRMFSKPAPALDSIRAWRFGEPVSLEALKGNVVLLTFFGSEGADPGTKIIPSLIGLHHAYAEHGLKIVAIHDPSIRNVQKFDERLAMLKTHYWANHEPQFPIGLDSHTWKKTPGKFFSWDCLGKTFLAYGINKTPTSVLINDDGTLAREIHPQVPLMQFELGRKLGIGTYTAIEAE